MEDLAEYITGQEKLILKQQIYRSARSIDAPVKLTHYRIDFGVVRPVSILLYEIRKLGIVNSIAEGKEVFDEILVAANTIPVFIQHDTNDADYLPKNSFAKEIAKKISDAQRAVTSSDLTQIPDSDSLYSIFYFYDDFPLNSLYSQIIWRMGDFPDSVTRRLDHTFIVSRSNAGFLLRMARRLLQKTKLSDSLKQALQSVRLANNL